MDEQQMCFAPPAWTRTHLVLQFCLADVDDERQALGILVHLGDGRYENQFVQLIGLLNGRFES